MKSYRTVIVGTGASVNNHTEAVAFVGERAELVAAVDLDEAKVKGFCEKHNIPNYFTDVGKMLEIVRPDLVHIVTPHWTHLPLVIQCLEAGAWVFCEKPLCRSLAEFEQIEAAEQRTGRYVSTVF